jgi:hypothetical protein
MAVGVATIGAGGSLFGRSSISTRASAFPNGVLDCQVGRPILNAILWSYRKKRLARWGRY